MINRIAKKKNKKLRLNFAQKKKQIVFIPLLGTGINSPCHVTRTIDYNCSRYYLNASMYIFQMDWKFVRMNFISSRSHTSNEAKSTTNHG